MATTKKNGDHLMLAYYVTGHGFGHATRVAEVVRHLIAVGHDVHVVTAVPDLVFSSEIQSPRLFIRKAFKILLGATTSDEQLVTIATMCGLGSYGTDG